MKRSILFASAIIAALIATNLWSVYAAFDCGISKTYLSASVDASAAVSNQLMAIVPIIAATPNDRTAVIAAASRAANNASPFEKGSYTWVGGLGMRFDAAGRLVHVTTDPSVSDT